MRDQASKLRELVSANNPSAKGVEVWKPTIIGFTSGKGGVGKTNIVINIGVHLAKEGIRVLILDADLSLANVDLLFGIYPQYNIKDVVLGDKKLEDIIVEGPHNIKIIPASSGVDELANLDDDKREEFINKFKEIEQRFDFIFIDTAAGVAKNVTKFLLISDEVVIVTTPELTALADAYAMIKVVSKNKSLSNIKILVNMVKTKTEAIETVERIRLVTSKFLGVEVEDFGLVYEDESVPIAVATQTPFMISSPYSRASNCMREIAEKIKKLRKKEREAKSLFERVIEVGFPNAQHPVDKDAKEVEPVSQLEVAPTSVCDDAQHSANRRGRKIRKVDIITQVASKLGITIKEAGVIIDNILSCIISAMCDGEIVKIRKFGVFRNKEREARKYYNPKSNQFTLSETRRIPHFSPSSALITEVKNAKPQ